MFLKTEPLLCLIVTLITLVFYTFMDRFFMFLKTALLCCLIVTLVTLVFYTFMDRFFMFLKKHKESVHEGVKYQCNQCHYQATQQSSLKKHKESVHEGVKYQCNQC